MRKAFAEDRGRSRREFLYGLGASVGAVAFNSMLAVENGVSADDATSPLAAKPGHVGAKAKRCIFLMMEGGPSHIDTFDPKPALEKLHLREFVREGEAKSAMESGKRYYVRSPFQFHRAGQSGDPALAPSVIQILAALDLSEVVTIQFEPGASVVQVTFP